MALTWDYDKKIGECVVYDGRTDLEYILDLYEGNAFLIALYEYHDTEEDKDKVQLQWFFADEQHAKNCLGITKGHSSIFDDGYLVSLHFDNPSKSRYLDKHIKLFLKAYPNLSITIN